LRCRGSPPQAMSTFEVMVRAAAIGPLPLRHTAAVETPD
jgi:hypothetical protein